MYAIAFRNRETGHVSYYTGKAGGEWLSPDINDAYFGYSAVSAAHNGRRMLQLHSYALGNHEFVQVDRKQSPMVKVKSSALLGKALDYAVAIADGREADCNFLLGGVEMPGCFVQINENYWVPIEQYNPSSSSKYSEAIIEREKIEITRGRPLYFPQGNEIGDHYEPLWLSGKQHGQTYLIAAMRHFVVMKLGDEVEIPAELLES